jgi:beta-glucosidase
MPDIEALLAAMTLEEKVTLLSGSGPWSTRAIPRLDIPFVKVTDGPNGARGNGRSGATAASFPVGSALAATWNRDLVTAIGEALGQEVRTKGAQVLLGPTMNLQRTPLGGRNFECFSEDPWLTGELATAYVRGVQSQRVGACLKHFVANDSEFERHTISSEVDERTLHELYLRPFEMAVTRARPWLVMSAYNRINGVYASSHRALLRDTLKGRWGFDGVVVSDWGAARETVENMHGGLDLEMPGPARTRGQTLIDAVSAGTVPQTEIDDSARRLLRLIERSGRFEDPLRHPEESVDLLEHRVLARRAAAEAMVLIRNRGALPLDPAAQKRIAVIGPNAEIGQIQGGGSSMVHPHYCVHPLEAFRETFADVIHAPGCTNHRYVPTPHDDELAAGDGNAGLRARFYAWDDEACTTPIAAALAQQQHQLFSFLWLGTLARGLPQTFRATLSAIFTPAVSGEHTFGVSSSGLSKVLLDGETIIDNWTSQDRGDAFFGGGSAERRAAVRLEAGRRYAYAIEYATGPEAGGTGSGGTIAGIRYGIMPPLPDDMLGDAVRAAERADAVVLVLGSDADWETEGADRRDMTLPGRQTELLERVLAARPDAIVVLNTGAPVAMPWRDRAGAVLQAWLPGQEFGHALADVIAGSVNPAGRMPCTVPERLEDTPAFTSYPGENGRVLYGERVFMGYRWYDMRGIEPAVPFGHGLSYTSFSYSELTMPGRAGIGDTITVECTITNTGARAGDEVVQLYIGDAAASVQRPPQELRAFDRIRLEPGERQRVRFALNPDVFAFWDAGAHEWLVEPGLFHLRIGASSRDIRLQGELTLER